MMYSVKSIIEKYIKIFNSFSGKIIILVLFVILLFSSCHKEKPWWWVPESFAEQPCWTPDGSKIAYCREQQIWITDTLGNTWNMFENCSLEAMLPDFSPDGTWLLFVSGHNIYKARVNENWHIDTSSIVQLTQTGNNFFPKWSPSGNKIVYDSNTKDDSVVTFYGICIMDTGGRDKRRIEGTWGDAREPDWSSNGDKIVYYGFFETTGEYAQLAIISLNDTAVNRLTSDSAWNSNPAWSPIDNRITFVKFIGGTETTETESYIWLINSDGSNLIRLTSGGKPTWSPDSRKIAFVDLDRNGEYETIWTIDLLSKKRKQIIFKEE